MRVLVVGSLPPPVTDRSRGLLAEVIRRRAEGAAVEVLSPTDYSVAHSYLEMPGPASAVEIALAARGADMVIVQLQPGFPFDEGAGRAGRAVGLGVLTTALRSVRGEVTVRLHSIHDLPHGVGGRAAEALWAVASHIDVGDEETLSRLVALVGDAGGRTASDRPSPRPRCGAQRRRNSRHGHCHCPGACGCRAAVGIGRSRRRSRPSTCPAPCGSLGVVTPPGRGRTGLGECYSLFAGAWLSLNEGSPCGALRGGESFSHSAARPGSPDRAASRATGLIRGRASRGGLRRRPRRCVSTQSLRL